MNLTNADSRFAVYSYACEGLVPGFRYNQHLTCLIYQYDMRYNGSGLVTYALLLTPADGGRTKRVGVLVGCGAACAKVWDGRIKEFVRWRAGLLGVELLETAGPESFIMSR